MMGRGVMCAIPPTFFLASVVVAKLVTAIAVIVPGGTSSFAQQPSVPTTIVLRGTSLQGTGRTSARTFSCSQFTPTHPFASLVPYPMATDQTRNRNSAGLSLSNLLLTYFATYVS